MKRRPVKRRYDATGRREAAARTRAAILEAATRAFVTNGYAATTMADVALEADVALDTIYSVVGAKHVLFRTLIEAAISGTDRAVPAEERDYVRAIRAEQDARQKLILYARAILPIHKRLAPLIRVLKEAAAADEALAKLWKSIMERRAANMRLFAAELAATGKLRPGLDIDEAADVIWAMNAHEVYLLLVGERGWSPERFEAWLSDALIRLLLDAGS